MSCSVPFKISFVLRASEGVANEVLHWRRRMRKWRVRRRRSCPR